MNNTVTKKDKLRSAAFKVGDEVYEAPTHYEAGKLVFQAGHKMGNGEETGYVTNSGQFISRAESYGIAKKAEQLQSQISKKREIYTEDLKPLDT